MSFQKQGETCTEYESVEWHKENFSKMQLTKVLLITIPLLLSVYLINADQIESNRYRKTCCGPVNNGARVANAPGVWIAAAQSQIYGANDMYWTSGSTSQLANAFPPGIFANPPVDPLPYHK